MLAVREFKFILKVCISRVWVLNLSFRCRIYYQDIIYMALLRAYIDSLYVRSMGKIA